MEQFNSTIEKLKTNYRHIIKVVNASNGQTLANNVSCDDLTKNYGSVEAFFEDLYQKGIRQVMIYDRKKNGTSTIKEGEPYTVTFGDKSTDVTAQTATQPMQQQPTFSTPTPTFQYGNQGTGMNGGMSAPEMIYKQMDHGRLERECMDLRSENKALLKQNAEYEKKILIHETLDGKSIAASTANKALVGEFMPLLAPLIGKLMETPAVPAAVGLMGAENLSETKKMALQQLQATDDGQVYYLCQLGKNLNNPAIEADFLALLEKYSLIQNPA